MSDYILLSRGMSEAEVLYRVGPPDHETVASDNHHHILKKTWYYIPSQSEVSNRQWITEIVFSGNGKVRSLDRFKP